MANKRDTSKQKRARENRAQREARKARAEAAAIAPEERRSRATATAAAPTTKAGRAAERSARTRPVRPGDVPVDLATLEGNALTKRLAVPGGRQVLFAFALTIVSGITLVVQKYPPASNPDGKRTLSFFEVAGGAAVPLLLMPPIIAGIAAALTLSPKRRRIWTVCAVALGAVTLAVLSLFLVNMLAVGFLVFGIQKALKVEGPAPGSRAAKQAEQRAAARAEADAEPADDDDA